MDLTTRVNLVRNLLKTKEFPIKTGAELLGINRTSVYYNGTPISQEELECKAIIDHPGVSLLAFEVYAFYIKSVARSFYSQLLLLWIPMRTKFPLCFLSAFFLMLFLIPFI